MNDVLILAIWLGQSESINLIVLQCVIELYVATIIGVQTKLTRKLAT